jgi:hypothetical protein
MLAISINPIDWVTSAAGAVSGAVSGAVFDQATEWVEGGLNYIAEQLGTYLSELGQSNLGDSTFEQLGGVFKYIALATVMITMLMGSSSSLLGTHKLSGVVQEIPLTLVMLAIWYAVVALWTEGTTALTGFFLTDSLIAAFGGGMTVSADTAGFWRLLIALALMVFLLIFMVEMLVLSHMMAIAAILGPLAIALRPWPSLKAVSGRMVCNLAALSLTPVLATASLALATSTTNEEGSLSFSAALGALAGLAVSILMPAMIVRFLPLGGDGGLGARGMMAAGVAVAGVAVAAAATGGVAAAAAPGAIGAVGGASDE